jgi:signal transduction histidine kinase
MESEIYLRAQQVQDASRKLEAANAELRQANRRIRELDELKSQFFANVSHELRTPLALILGPAEQLSSGSGLSPDARLKIETIRRNASALLKHVNDLLDIARLEAGKMDVTWASVDLVRLVNRMAGNFESVADTRQIRYSVDAPAALRAAVDPDKIERVLLNLISNAFKFVPDGGTISCTLRNDGDDAVSIIVEDSGPGIPEDLRDAIFERFRQLDAGLSRRVGGTGLGLAIVKEFVDLHRGTVSVDNSPLGGARFTVRLPVAAPEGVSVLADDEPSTRVDEVRSRLQEPVAAPAPVPRENAAGAASVLIVEDNPEMSAFIAELLAPDYSVVIASNGREGLARALSNRPDLIVTDLMMPDMSGDELVRAVRSRPELRGVPIMLLSAKADEETTVKLLRDGADDYLKKPVAVDELRARVGNLVNVKRTRDVLQTELASRTHNLDDLAGELRASMNALRENDDLLRKALQDAEEANRAKDEFLMILSHELRTPLTAIIGWAEVLRLDRSDPEAMSAGLETIERSARVQASLIEEMLDASRIITGQIRLRLEPISLPALINQILDSLRPSAAEKNLIVQARLPDSKEPMIGDPSRLQQIVSNLLSNAMKFTPSGGRVSIALEQNSRFATLTVSDTGIGIRREFLPHVFDRFRQADSSRTRAHGGLGLGLSIVRHLVELHGGWVAAESPGEGQGTTFRITLPIIDPDVTEKVAPSRTTSELPDLVGKSILLVDDEPDTLRFLSIFLRRCGAEVRCAGSVTEAMSALADREPDIVVTDIAMPGGDGFSLLENIQMQRRDVPTVALTAMGSGEERDRYIAAGFREHIAKPSSPLEIARRIASVVV